MATGHVASRSYSKEVAVQAKDAYLLVPRQTAYLPIPLLAVDTMIWS